MMIKRDRIESAERLRADGKQRFRNPADAMSTASSASRQKAYSAAAGSRIRDGSTRDAASNVREAALIGLAAIDIATQTFVQRVRQVGAARIGREDHEVTREVRHAEAFQRAIPQVVRSL